MSNLGSRLPKKVVGLNFAHMHMGDLLRFAHDHPGACIAGIWDDDAARMLITRKALAIADESVFGDLDECMAATKPDMAILCPPTSEHARLVERVAQWKVPILIEKPFAYSLADADRMIAACEQAGVALAINWPMAWYPTNRTAKRLISEGVIGELQEVHYYDGNRGPIFHGADKVEIDVNVAMEQKKSSWWYRKDRGGGSLLDYLGYGVTLATWFFDGRVPDALTTVMDAQADLEVDEHSITICRYGGGLSKFETRWGTFTDPWTCQPQPKCGFVLVGTDGTIAAHDFEPNVTVQTRKERQGRSIAVDTPIAPCRNPVEYFLHCIETGEPVQGPLSPRISRIGQLITDCARLSATEGRTVGLKA